MSRVWPEVTSVKMRPVLGLSSKVAQLITSRARHDECSIMHDLINKYEWLKVM